mmetsp:Transcript_40254/g.61429  ORF Transcript_40254/g.61429 Transcript_40254/m.61429 type:complete len:91 (+) Transcript_40254:704-976(+)
MDMLDLDHKWIYDGSAAYPPCLKRVAWQVLDRVYPIEYKYMYMIRQIFLDHADELKATSNIRGIHPVNGHEVYYVGGRILKIWLVSVVLL